MEYISIDGTKLMITLSKEDMREYGFPGNGDSGEGNADRLRKIMNKIEKNTGFDARGYRVEVRVFPSKCGGCEMYLFRSPYVENGRRISETKKTGHASTAGKITGSTFRLKADGEKSENQRFYADDCTIYRFRNLADAAQLCKRLNACNYWENADLYYINTNASAQQKRYYLVFSREISYANEYNGIPVSRKQLSFVKEHGCLICRDAVNVLPTYF